MVISETATTEVIVAVEINRTLLIGYRRLFECLERLP
jgi:hypothetical protein